MKTHISGIIIGILIAALAYHIYIVYQMKKVIVVHTQQISEIVNFINANITQPTPPPAKAK